MKTKKFGLSFVDDDIQKFINSKDKYQEVLRICVVVVFQYSKKQIVFLYEKGMNKK